MEGKYTEMLMNEANFQKGSGFDAKTFQLISLDFINRVHLQQALGSNPNPFYFSLLGDTAQVLPLKGFVVAHLPVLAFRSW